MTRPSGGESSATTFAGADMSGARFEWSSLRGASFRGVDLSEVRMRGVYLAQADIDGDIEGLRIAGVEVQPLIDAELDRRHPERAALRANDPDGLRAGWDELQAMWAATLQRISTMPVGSTDVSVDGEWSVAQTLRHLLLATDAWLGAAILRRERPFHPSGLLFTEFVGRESDYGLDAAAQPSFGEVLEARAGRVAMVSSFLDDVTAEQLSETRDDPWGGPWHPTVLLCVQVIFVEEWHHHRYLVRDLAVIDADAEAEA